MKKVVYGILSILFLAAISISCEEILGDLVNFDGEYYVMEFTVEPTSVTGLAVFTSEDYNPKLDSLLEEYGLDRETLSEVTLAEALVVITSEETNFDFLDKFEVIIESSSAEAKKIAWKDTIPDGQIQLALVLSGDDIKDFLFDEEFTLTAQGVLNTAVEQPVRLMAKVKFHFKGSSGDSNNLFGF